MGFVSVLEYAKRLVIDRVRQGDWCLDATVGNGIDTAFLADLAGSGGRVLGFDIQAQALRQAYARLEHLGIAVRIMDNAARVSAAEAIGQSLDVVTLIGESHDRMADFVPPERRGQFAAAMFNLGYLPGGDHSVITRPDSTVRALDASLKLLRPGGVVTAVLYTGHAGGAEEEAAVREWAAGVDQRTAQVLEYRFLNQKRNPPYLLAVLKH